MTFNLDNQFITSTQYCSTTALKSTSENSNSQQLRECSRCGASQLLRYNDPRTKDQQKNDSTSKRVCGICYKQLKRELTLAKNESCPICHKTVREWQNIKNDQCTDAISRACTICVQTLKRNNPTIFKRIEKKSKTVPESPFCTKCGDRFKFQKYLEPGTAAYICQKCYDNIRQALTFAKGEKCPKCKKIVRKWRRPDPNNKSYKLCLTCSKLFKKSLSKPLSFETRPENSSNTNPLATTSMASKSLVEGQPEFSESSTETSISPIERKKINPDRTPTPNKSQISMDSTNGTIFSPFRLFGDSLLSDLPIYGEF